LLRIVSRGIPGQTKTPLIKRGCFSLFCVLFIRTQILILNNGNVKLHFAKIAFVVALMNVERDRVIAAIDRL
jgi:hypothetical protein